MAEKRQIPVTKTEIMAARLRVALDVKARRETPPWIRKIADVDLVPSGTRKLEVPSSEITIATSTDPHADSSLAHEGTRLPVYFLLDTSASMAAHMAALNEVIEDSLSSLYDPLVASVTSVSVLTFSHVAERILPLTPSESLTSVPHLTADTGGTNYGAAFKLLRQTIAEDMERLSTSGYTLFRPLAFFVTDGEPTDQGWESAYLDLVDTGWKWYPDMVIFGFGNASERTLSRLADQPAFIATQGESVADALRNAFTSITSTITSTATTGSPGLVNQAQGFDRIRRQA